MSTQILSVSDHLTDADTIDFWRRYFADMPNDEVSVDAFCDAVQSEFSQMVIKPVTEDIPEGAVSMEVLLEEFYTDLANKVSID